MPARGRFVTFEGGDGAGKSTQARLLLEALENSGIAARGTREPGGSPGGEAIRRLIFGGDNWDAVSETLLIVAARRDHVCRLIAPALAEGIWVVCDRFADSTLAYQGYGRGLPLSGLNALNRFALGDFAPDLTLILDLPVEIALARAAARTAPADRFERLGRDFQEKLRRGYRAIEAKYPARCLLLDAARSVEEVHRAVCDAVRERLGTPLLER